MDIVSSYVNHSLNKSKAKAAYSFPRSERMKQSTKALNNSSVYQLPSLKSKRSCSFGYGSKTDLANKSSSPPPGAYEAKSSFHSNGSNSIAFGKSRNDVKFQNFLSTIEKLKKIPAPNAYKNPDSTLSNRGGRIAARLPTDIDYITKKKTPGPGAYEPKHLDLHDNGSFFLSKFKNKPSPRYHNPQKQSSQRKQRLSTVGPGTYNSNVVSFGKSAISRYRNSIAGTIPRSERKGIIDSEKLKIPGHKYSSFSQFGDVRK